MLLLCLAQIPAPPCENVAVLGPFHSLLYATLRMDLTCTSPLRCVGPALAQHRMVSTPRTMLLSILIARCHHPFELPLPVRGHVGIDSVSSAVEERLCLVHRVIVVEPSQLSAEMIEEVLGTWI